MNHVLDIEALSKIALLGGAYDWRETPIEVTATASATDPVRLAQEGWWKRAEPRDASGREIIRLLERGGLGRLRDASEEHLKQAYRESEKGPTSAEIAERQRDKAQRRREGAAGDEEDPQTWKEYLGSPADDARAWLRRLGAKVDANTLENKGFFDTLIDHIRSKPAGARVSDLNQELVAFCLKAICSE